MSLSSCRCGRRGAFTLIELLVVVSIIALLISILLPSLRSAKESSRTVVCLANMREMLYASLYYANDYADQIFPSNPDGGQSIPTIGGAWARLPGPDNTVKPGLLYDYCYNISEIAECPTNRRQATSGTHDGNMWGEDRPLDFDYTMVGNAHGIRIDRKLEVGYQKEPEKWGNWVLPPAITISANIRKIDGVFLFAEEDTRFWNQDTDDGLWSNGDQITVRHKGVGNLAFLDGHVASFKTLRGAHDDVYEPEDQDANDFYVHKLGDIRWYRIELQSGTFHQYGWINNPE